MRHLCRPVHNIASYYIRKVHFYLKTRANCRSACAGVTANWQEETNKAGMYCVVLSLAAHARSI